MTFSFGWLKHLDYYFYCFCWVFKFQKCLSFGLHQVRRLCLLLKRIGLLLLTAFKPRCVFLLSEQNASMITLTQAWPCMRWCPGTPCPGRSPIQSKAAQTPPLKLTSPEREVLPKSLKCASAPTTTWARTSPWSNATMPGKLRWGH